MPEKSKLPTWRTLLYDFTQDTTLHGIRFITQDTWYTIRRVLWLLAVVGAFVVFAYINALNVKTYLGYPKSMTVEVNPTPWLEFPAVTICNYNKHRLTGLVNMGLYDNVWEYNMQINNASYVRGDNSCMDTFTYYEGLCDENLTSYLYEVQALYHDVSEIACEQVCTDLYDLKCSAVLYNRTDRLCLISSVIKERPITDTTRCPSGSLEYYRRNRCKVLPDIQCSFDGNDCPDLFNYHNGTSVENWVTIEASGNHPSVDHTMRTERGRYIFLKRTQHRSQHVANLQSRYLNLNNSCLEFYYAFTGNASDTELTIKVWSEDLAVFALETFTPNSVSLAGWVRALVRLPDGIYQVVIEGRRPRDGTSGIALDDVFITSCVMFEVECKYTTDGFSYRGTHISTWEGSLCANWQHVASLYNIYYEVGPNSKNFCRSPDKDEQGPWCFTEGLDWGYCPIPYCPCNQWQFKCDDGLCIPAIYICDGIMDCPDGSDESKRSVCATRGFECDFEDSYMCGYTTIPSALTWIQSRALDITNAFGPSSDPEGLVLGGFMYVENRQGSIGDRAFLKSVGVKFRQGTCLSFILFNNFTEYDIQRNLRVSLLEYHQKEHMRSMLYQTKGDENEGPHSWRRYYITVPSGHFIVEFEYTMGGPFASAVALDNVTMLRCSDIPTSYSVITGTYAQDTVVRNISCSFAGENACGYGYVSSRSLADWKFIPLPALQNITATKTDDACVQTYWATQGFFEFPMNPGMYPNNYEECVAHIQAPSASHITLEFNLDHFDVERGEYRCEYDKVEIRVDDLFSRPLHVLCNGVVSEKYIIEATDVYVSVVTDETERRRGFVADYYFNSSQDESYGYVLFDIGVASEDRSWSTLYSVTVANDQNYCLSFSYILTRDVYLKLALHETDIQVIHSLSAPGAFEQSKIRLNLPAGQYQVGFSFEYFRPLGYIAAVYDIVQSGGLCQEIYTHGSLACNFTSPDLCGYLDLSDGPARWFWKTSEARMMVQGMLVGLPTLASPPVIHTTDLCVVVNGVAECDNFEGETVMLILSLYNAEDLGTPHQLLGSVLIMEDGGITVNVPLVPGTHRVLLTAKWTTYCSMQITQIAVSEGTCSQKNNTFMAIGNFGDFVNIGSVPSTHVTPAFQGSLPMFSVANPPDSYRKQVSDSIDVYNFYVGTSHMKDDLINRCTYDGEQCTSDDFELSLTSFGVCYTFNSANSSIQRAYNAGTRHGLSLVLNIEQYDYMDGASQDAGVKVHMHHQGDISSVRDMGIAVAPAFHTSMDTAKIRSISLPPPWGQCGNKSLSLYPDITYTLSRCKTECEQVRIGSECGCQTFYTAGESDLDYCSVSEEVTCVVPVLGSQDLVKCSCPLECDLVAYRVSPSMSALSSLGVDQILQTGTGRLEYRYHTAFELRPRMDKDLFTQIMKSMRTVSSSVSDYMEFSETITMSISLSKFYLIQEAIQKFSSILKSDYDSLLRIEFPVSGYRSQYNAAYARRYDARQALIEETTRQLIHFMEHNVNTTDISTLNSEALSLRQKMRMLIKPFNISGTLPIAAVTDLLPQTLFPQRDVELQCTQLTFAQNVTQNALEALDALSRYDHSVSVSNLSITDFLDLVDWMQDYADKFIFCTSIYSSFLSTIESLSSFFYELSAITMTLAETYNFEVESKGLQSFQDMFIEKLLLPYEQSNISLLDMARDISTMQLKSIETTISLFRNKMKAAFDTSISSFLASYATEFRAMYLQLLNVFAPGQDFFGEKVNLREIVSSLSIWRIPSCDLTGDEILTYEIPQEAVRLVWPDNMDLTAFQDTQAILLLDRIHVNVFKALQAELDEIDVQFVTLGNNIVDAFYELQDILSSYASEAKIDESFVLKNFLLLDVYFGEMQYELIEQSQAYPLPKFFSDMGGFLGLLLGASVLTVCELLDLIVYSCVRKLHSRFIVRQTTVSPTSYDVAL